MNKLFKAVADFFKDDGLEYGPNWIGVREGHSNPAAEEVSRKIAALWYSHARKEKKNVQRRNSQLSQGERCCSCGFRRIDGAGNSLQESNLPDS